MLPNFDYESLVWSRGFNFVVGVDEVGRGSFAGPVVAACVGFDSGVVVPATVGIRDSKLLTHNGRKMALSWIKSNSSVMGVGKASVEEINIFGIVGATNHAFTRSVKNAEELSGVRANYLLVDGRDAIKSSEISVKQKAIVKGDSLSVSIAAASIVAKVYRDELMIQLARRKDYAKYDWHNNKGYGTLKHREAILRYGITKHHRKQFVDTFIRKRRSEIG